MNFATVDDVIALWRPLTTSERSRVEALLPIVSDALRVEAANAGKDLDEIVTDRAMANVAKSVVVDVISRMVMADDSQAPMSQFSESALGYSFSGTYLNPGGGVFIKRSELKRLGLTKQKYGVLEMYRNDKGCHR